MENCCLCGLVLDTPEELEDHIDQEHNEIFSVEENQKMKAEQQMLEDSDDTMSDGSSGEDDANDDSDDRPLKHSKLGRGHHIKKEHQPDKNEGQSDDEGDDEERHSDADEHHYTIPKVEIKTEREDDDGDGYEMVVEPGLKCSECDFMATTIHLLREHQITKHVAQQHFLSDFERHNLSNNTTVCKICSKDLKSKKLLLRHQLQVHPKIAPIPNASKCDVCGKQFRNIRMLTCHKNAMHAPPKPKPICDICSKEYKSHKILRRHQVRVHIAPKPAICDVCNVNFETRRILLSHKSKEHPDLSAIVTKCNICNKEYKNRKMLSQHKSNVHSAQGEFLCPMCDDSFSSKRRLYLHKKTVHECKKWQCDECGKIFGLKVRLDSHIKSCHSTDNKITCRVCKKYLSWKNFSEKNSEMIDGKKEYKCLNCTKRGDVPDGSAPPPLPKVKCDLCNKDYSSNAALAKHKVFSHVITVQDRVICQICNKDFKNKGVLYIHNFDVHIMNSHFPCHLCDKSFATRCGRNVHKRSAHGSKKWQCEPCGKAFGQKVHFNNHNISVHSHDNKVHCIQCQKVLSFKNFTQKNTMIIDGQKVSTCYSCTKKSKQILENEILLPPPQHY